MTCIAHEAHIDATWPALLELQRTLLGLESGIHDAFRWAPAGRSPAVGRSPATPPDSPWSVRMQRVGAPATRSGERELCRARRADCEIVAFASSALCEDEANVLRLYLPILFGAHLARVCDEVFVTGHVAQSLDGRVACANGHSQWISNLHNQRHSHRLRALHDAVLVGSGTVHTDDPRLTVRHVEGRNPERAIVSGSGNVLELVWSRAIFRDAGCVVLTGANSAPTLPAKVQCEVLEHDENGHIPAKSLLRALANRGLHSIFVEGGPVTLSSFLNERALDLLHVHIAPRILGSGAPAFTLPVITEVEQGPKFICEHYDFGGEILIVARPESNQ